MGITSLDLTDLDWLLFSEQRLLEFTSGSVFNDSLGELSEARNALQYFPNNVWVFKLIAEWNHLAEERSFIGRTGSLNDDLGSRIEAARLIRLIIRLTFILEKKYFPYSKWLTRSFTSLKRAKKLHPLLLDILKAADWRIREKLLCEAYLILLDQQNKLNITPEIKLTPESYFSRDQTVVNIDKITEELKKLLKPPLSDIKYQIGSLDHFIDETSILTDLGFVRSLIAINKKKEI